MKYFTYVNTFSYTEEAYAGLCFRGNLNEYVIADISIHLDLISHRASDPHSSCGSDPDEVKGQVQRGWSHRQRTSVLLQPSAAQTLVTDWLNRSVWFSSAQLEGQIEEHDQRSEVVQDDVLLLCVPYRTSSAACLAQSPPRCPGSCGSPRCCRFLPPVSRERKREAHDR